MGVAPDGRLPPSQRPQSTWLPRPPRGPLRSAHSLSPGLETPGRVCFRSRPRVCPPGWVSGAAWAGGEPGPACELRAQQPGWSEPSGRGGLGGVPGLARPPGGLSVGGQRPGRAPTLGTWGAGGGLPALPVTPSPPLATGVCSPRCQQPGGGGEPERGGKIHPLPGQIASAAARPCPRLPAAAPARSPRGAQSQSRAALPGGGRAGRRRPLSPARGRGAAMAGARGAAAAAGGRRRAEGARGHGRAPLPAAVPAA